MSSEGVYVSQIITLYILNTYNLKKNKTLLAQVEK